MSQTNTFAKRVDLTSIITNNLENLFNSDDVEIIPFGVEKICGDNIVLDRFIKDMASNETWSAMLVKFAPDYILLTKNKPQSLFFLEVKTTVTPLWSLKNVNEIRDRYNGTKLTDIGVIAREAWNAYNNLYPNCIVLAGCSYNPKLLMAQFVKNIRCLRCFGGYDCDDCPMKKGELFKTERNYNSTGSQTPQTNIDYSTFYDCEQFFSGLNIRINKNMLENVKQQIKERGVNFPTNVYDMIKDNIIKELKKDGCTWL